MTVQLEHRPRGNYSEEEIDHGLTVVAICSGNTRRAAELLASHSRPIPRGTLEKWQNRTHRDRYLETVKREGPGLKLRLAEENEDLGRLYMRMERENLERMAEKMGDPDASLKDRAIVSRDLGVGKGIAFTKAAELRGDPTSIIEHRSVSETYRHLKRLGLIVDGDATEVSEPASRASLPSPEPDAATTNEG